MALFCIEYEDTLGIRIFLKNMDKLLKEGDITKAASTGKVEIKKNWAIINIELKYPNIPALITFIALGLYIVFPNFFLGFIGGLALFSSLLWTYPIQYHLLKRGLRKAGYTGKMKLLSNDEALRRLINGTN